MIVAKLLQVLGMVQLLAALYYGIVLKEMGKEFILLLVGVVLFLLGRLIERRAAR